MWLETPAPPGLTLARTRHFAILDGTRGEGATPPLGVSKLSVVELSGKDRRIALDEYSRLVARFWTLGQNLAQLTEVKCQYFGKSALFQRTLSYLKNVLLHRKEFFTNVFYVQL